MIFIKTRIILTVPCIGKTYADKHFKNLYDFDKHTLEYKYDKTGYEHLSNEEFKGIPNRKINDNWFEHYMTDWCKLINSDEYDIVVGWLYEDCIEYLHKNNYPFEAILINPTNNNLDEYFKRSKARGNSDQYWENTQKWYLKSFEQHRNDPRINKIYVLEKPIYLSDFIQQTGTTLIPK